MQTLNPRASGALITKKNQGEGLSFLFLALVLLSMLLVVRVAADECIYIGLLLLLSLMVTMDRMVMMMGVDSITMPMLLAPNTLRAR